MYFASNRNGQGASEFDEEGNPKGVSYKDNRIMASKLHGNTFCEPYVFCHVNHPIESMTAVKEDLCAMAFFCTEITDFANSQASIWYTSVPSVVCPTITDVELLTPLVSAGDYAHFLLTIRNDGNMHITGATAMLLDEQGNEVSSGRIEFTDQTRQVSVWNPPEGMEVGDQVNLAMAPLTKTALRTGSALTRVATPRGDAASGAAAAADASTPVVAAPLSSEGEELGRLLSGDEAGFALSDYELSPGKKAVYAVALQVPADWSGERTVTVGLRDTRYVGVANVSGDNDPLLMNGMNTVKDGSLLSVAASVGADHDVNQDAPVSVEEKDAAGPTPAAPRGSAAAKTADPLSLGGAAALAIGAASAGLLAYSARRQANESDEGTGRLP